MKSIEKLREYADKLRAYPGVMTWGYVATIIDAITDEIEAEISERHMPLPLDADGVPIRIGDGLALQYEVREKPSEVESITFDGEDWYFTSSDGFFNTAGFHHVKPRTIEDVLEEFGSKMHGITAEERERLVNEAADEIRGMM